MTDNVNVWLADFTIYLHDADCLNEIKKLELFKRHLKAMACEIFEQAASDSVNTYVKATEYVRELFKPRLNRDALSNQLSDLQLGNYELLSTYLQRVRLLVHAINPHQILL